MFTNKTFDNQSNIKADSVTTNSILSYTGSVAISTSSNSQGNGNLAIGYLAGVNQGQNATAIGIRSGASNQGISTVAVGSYSGQSNQGESGLAIGTNSGNVSQSTGGIAIGALSGFQNQGQNAISIGVNCGYNAQGANAIAIGTYAANSGQGANSIVLNASGAILNGTTANACYVAPIRPNIGTNVLYYDNITKEITYGAFRYIPWTSCGYTITAGSSFGGAITATTAPNPAIGSMTNYTYSIIGNSMYLSFTYTNSTVNGGGAGSGVYLYNIPSGYTINTSLIQTALPATGTSQTCYGTKVGTAQLSSFSGSSSSFGCNVYCSGVSQLVLFAPVYIAGATTGTLYAYQQSSVGYSYAGSSGLSYTFECCIPIT